MFILELYSLVLKIHFYKFLCLSFLSIKIKNNKKINLNIHLLYLINIYTRDLCNCFNASCMILWYVDAMRFTCIKHTELF